MHFWMYSPCSIIYPLLKNCYSLILEGFAELHDLSSLGVDGEWSHTEVTEVRISHTADNVV